MARKSASRVYQRFAQAMRERKQIICSYQGLPREVCPIVLGHKNEEERALTFQFAGRSTGPIPDWRCLVLSKVTNVELRDGEWFAGDRHTRPQGCVTEVDLDINPASPYGPRRKLK
jgi:hypothetical protein